MTGLYDDDKSGESEITQNLGSPNITPVEKIQGVTGVGSITPTGSKPNIAQRTLTSSYQSKQQEDTAQSEAQLQYTTGVARVADSEEAEEWLSAKQLYEKTLGVTEYEELRNKLNLRDDESFTDYYNRTHYIPEGFEVQARLLLAEEKRKKLYVEVQQGNMSEEDFLYEAYGKDLLKEEGIDFSSSLYWYNRYKSGDYSDPRKNDTFMLQLIENARDIFTAEKWYEDVQSTNLSDTLAKYVTGEKLPASSVAEIFGEQFEQFTEYFNSQEQVIKYYRGGLLQGFNPTIDADGDGKIDYYYAPDGKLYNVNETGEGANTMKAYYNSDGSLNRIVASDSIFGEVASETLKGFAGFFTGVADLFGLLGGLVVDLGEGLFTGDWELDKTANVSAAMQGFWNGTFLGDKDYIVDSGFTTSDGSANWAGIARSGGRLLGTIGAFVATMGLSSIGGAAKAASTATTTGVKAGIKRGALKLVSGITSTAVRLTGYASGNIASGTLGGILANAATTAMKDSISGAVALTVNNKYLHDAGVIDHEMTAGEILGKSFASFGVEFVAGVALRSAVGTQALDRYAGLSKGIKDGSIKGLKSFLTYSPQLLKVTTNSLKQRIAIGAGNMAMDAVENIFSAWAQTSYASKGKVLDLNSLGSVLNSPSLWLNIVYQTKQNFKDNFSISSQEIVANTTNIAEMELSAKQILREAYENAEDIETANIFKQTLQQYDQKITEYQATTKSATAGSLKAFEELAMSIGWLEKAEGFEPKYQQDLTSLKNPVNENIQKCYNKVSELNYAYTHAMFDYINEVYNKQQAAATNIFKRKGFQFLYGKDMQNYTINVLNQYRSIIGNSNEQAAWEAAINDTFLTTKLFQNNLEELGSTGEEALKHLDDGQIAFGKLVEDKDGKIKVEDSLAEHLSKGKDQEAFNKYMADINEQAAQGKINDAMSDVFILTGMTGTEADGIQERQDAIKNLHVIRQLFDLVNGDGTENSNPYVKEYGDTFVIKFYGIGAQLQTVEQVRGMLQTLTAIKMSAYDTNMINPDMAGKYMRILLSYFTSSTDEASNLFSTAEGANASAQVIDLLLKSKLITYSQAARLIDNLNAHLGTINKGKDKAPTSLPVKEFGPKGLLTTNSNQTPTPSDYLKAQEMLEDIKTIGEAQEIAIGLAKYSEDQSKFSKRYKKLSASEQAKLDKASSIIKKDKEYVKLLTDEGIITKDLTKTLNPFTTDFESKGTQENLRQASSSESSTERAEREKILNAIGGLLGLSEEVSDDEIISFNVKGTSIETTLGELRTWKTFSKFLEVSEEGSKAYDIIKKKIHKISNNETINSLKFIDNLAEEYNNKQHAVNDAKLVNKSINTVRNLYVNFLAEAIPSILDSFELDCDAEVFYKPWGGSRWSTDIKGKLENDFVSKNTDIAMLEVTNTQPLSFGALINFIKEHKLPTQLNDVYAELDAELSVLKESAVNLTNDTITIRFGDVMGPATAKVAKLLSNDEVRSRLLGKTDAEIKNELFTTKKQYYDYRKEQATINHFHKKYGDEITVSVKDAGPILSKLGINLAGDILYTNYSTPISGIYYTNGQQGIELGNSKALAKLQQLANTSNKKSITSKLIYQDPIAKADTMASGFNFASLDDKATQEINLYPEIEDNSTAVALSENFEKVVSNNKIGKYASQTKEVTISNVAPASSDTYNMQHQAAMYMYDIIDWLDAYCKNSDDKKGPSISPLIIKSNSKPMDYSSLWNVSTVEENGIYTTTITPKKDIDFKAEAIKLLQKKGLNSETIRLIIPNNADFDRTTTVLKAGLGNQTLNVSQTPAALISSNLLNSEKYHFSDEFFVQKLLNGADDFAIDSLDLTQYDSAIESLATMTRQEVLNYSGDNIFMLIKKHEIEYEEHMKNYMVEQLKLWCYDTPEEQQAIDKLIYSKDARRDIGAAINTLVVNQETSTAKPEYFKEGVLIINDDFITKLKNTLKTTTEVKAIIDNNPEVLKGYLALLNVTSFVETSYDWPPDTLEAKLYAAIRAATVTGSDTLKISYLDLYRLTDEELDKTNEILKSLGLKQIPKKLLTTIKNSEIRRVPDQETLPSNIAIEQSEKPEPTYSPSRGFIVSNSDLYDSEGNINQSFRLEDNEYMENLIARRKQSKLGNLFIKFAALDTQTNSLHAMAISKGLDKYSKNTHSGVLGYIPYKSSLMRANFNYKELEYRMLSNVSDFAMDLSEYDFFSSMNDIKLANIALSIYDLTSGTEYQGVHPDYMLVNKNGDIVNISSSDYSNGHYTYDNLVSAILKSGNNVDDIAIIHLNRNSMNTTFSGSTMRPEVYKLSENIDLINLMIKQKIEAMSYKYNIKPNERSKAIAKTSEYYAMREMKTPKFYNDLLYSAAKDIGVSEDAIQDYLTAKENLSFTSRLNTQQEQVLDTIKEQEDAEFTNYQLQQLRDIQSYGETENTFYNHEGIKDALDSANRSIKSRLTFITETNHKEVDALLESFAKNKEEGIGYLNSYIKNNIDAEHKEEFILDLLNYYISKQDSISSSLLKLSDTTLETFDNNCKNFSSIELFRVNNDNTTSKLDTPISIEDIKARPKLVLDIEQLYDGAEFNSKEHVFQIAYKYGDDTPKTVYLGKGLPDSLNDLQEMFGAFFDKYVPKDSNVDSGARAALLKLLEVPNADRGMEEFIQVLKQAQADKALLVGYNSNSFDIPKLLSAKNLQGYDLSALRNLECLDIFELAKRLPTTDNIDQFQGKLQLENLAEQFGLKIQGSHDADVDIQTTEAIMNRLLDNAITQDTHQAELLNNLKTLYKGLTGNGLESTEYYKQAIGNKSNIDVVNKTLSYMSNPNKLYSFSKITNIINEKAMSDYFNIRKKELDLNIKTHNYKNIIDFANMMTHKGNNSKALNIMDFFIKNIPEEIDKSTESKLLSATKLLKAFYKDKKKLKSIELIDIFSDLDTLKEAVLTLTDKTEEDFNEHHSTQEINNILSKYRNVSADSIATEDAAFFTNRSLEPYEKLLEDTIYSRYPSIASAIKQEMTDSLMRFYDLPSTADGQLKVTRVKSPTAINMLSKTQQEIIDWLKTSPILKAEDESIYEMAQTTYNHIKLLDGTTERPKNDTLYMTENNFKRLMNNMDLNITTVTDYYGSDGILYIPVIRHPRDIADSLHFMKVKLIEDHQGFEVVMNIDTMKTRFNGDFDGDHLTILKPQKYLSEYATVVNKYKNASGAILDDVLTTLIDNPDTPFTPYAPIEYLIPNNKSLSSQITKDLNKLRNATNYLQEYNNLKEQFISNEKNIAIIKSVAPNLDADQIKQALEDIYLVEPIAIKSTVTKNANSYITYSDYFGVNKAKENITNKKLYTKNSISQAITLSKFDSTSGMYQKVKLQADMSEFEDQFNLINKAFTLSPTTRNIIMNNFDTVKSILLANNSIDTDTKVLIETAKTARDIELALRVHQVNQNYAMEADTQFKNVLTQIKREDDPFAKALLAFSSGDNNYTEDEALSKFIYTCEEITKLAEETKTGFVSRPDNTSLNRLLDYTSGIYKKGIISKKGTTLDAMQKPFKNLILLNNDNNRYNIVSEDGYLLLPQIKEYNVVLPKAVKLSESDMNYMNKYIKKQQNGFINVQIPASDTKAYNILGLSKASTYDVIAGFAEDNVLTVYKQFGLSSTKTGARGWKDTKGVPQGYADISKLPQELQSVAAECSILRDATYMDTDNILSTFNIDDNYEIIKDASGKPLAIVCDMDQSCLEATATFNKDIKSKPSDDLDIGNSLLDTGGLWQTHAAFVSLDENGNLTYDDKGHSAMMKKYAELNNPYAKQHSAVEVYENLRFAILSPYITDDMCKDFNCSSKEEYILKCLKLPVGTLRNKIELLKQKVNRSDIKDNLITKLLYDAKLEAMVYGYTADTSVEDSKVTTKGANQRDTRTQSPIYSESQAGGGIKALDTFGTQPNMSLLELFNYLDQGDSIRESNIQRLMQQGYLPVGGYQDDDIDYSKLSADSAKIGETIPAITKDMTGPQIFQGVPKDLLEYDRRSEYNSYNAQTGYLKTLENSPLKRSSKLYNQEINSLVLFMKALSPDMDGKFNKYSMLDVLSTGTNRYIASLDPTVLQFKDQELNYMPRQYRDKSEQLIPIRGDQFIDDLISMRASPEYYSYKQKESEQLVDPISKAELAPTYHAPEYDQDELIKGFQDLKANAPRLSEENAAAFKQYKEYTYTVEDLNRETSRNNVTYGGKVYKDRKIFEKETIMMNHGLKLKDADDLNQDRNLKQTAVDMINYNNDYNKDILRLYNYANNSGTTEQVNTYAYLLAAKNKLEIVNNKYKKSNSTTEAQIETQTILDSLKFLEVTTVKDIDTKIEELTKTNKTEVYFVNKILYSLKKDSEDYAKLLNLPSNIFTMITNNASPDKKTRKGLVQSFKNIFNNKTSSNAPEVKQDQLPLYDTFNFLDSVTATTQQIAKTKAIYENSIRLRRSGIIDNTKIHSILLDTIEANKQSIEAADLSQYREGLSSIIKSIDNKFSNYLDSNDDGTGFYDRLMQIDYNLTPNSKVPVGKSAIELFQLLSEISSSLGISYETARTDTANLEDSARFISLVEYTQDMFATISALTNDTLVESLVKNISDYAKQNNLSLVDSTGKMVYTDKVLMLHDLDMKAILDEVDKAEVGKVRYLADRIMKGDVYLMDSGLAETYAKTIFKEYKKPGFLMNLIRKSSNLCIKLIMSSPFKLVDRFLKFTAFDAATLGSANINTFQYEGESFKDLKAYFMSKGSYCSDNLNEFLQTQGIKMNGDNFNIMLNTDNTDSYNLFKSYTDSVGNVFTFQTLSQRYAYWLATKQSIKDGDYSKLGSAYYLRDAIKDMEGIIDSDGTVRVSKEGQQAAFAMSQMLGSGEDFPGISKTLSNYGFVFTTFPLAAMRWGIGELRSMGSAVKGMFSEGIRSNGSRWLLQNTSGLIATFIAERVLVGLVCDMFGVTDEEDEEEWKEQGALPDLTRSIIQGQPIMDTFSSMNPARELYELTVAPLVGNTSGDNLSGLQRFIYKNIVSHVNPVIKNVGELVTKKDLIDDQLIDTTDKYTGFENVFRKLSSYIIGASGANALVKTIHNDPSLGGLTKGFNNAIAAEMGNTKAQKENQKNYYNMIALVNSYKDYDNSTYTSSEDFNYNNYSQVKSRIYTLINNKASSTEVYTEINNLLQEGYTYYEIRAAVKNCSLSHKLESLDNYAQFFNSLLPGEVQNLKTALAYEEYMFPWIEDTLSSISTTIQQSKNNRYGYLNLYNIKPKTYAGTYTQPDYTLPKSKQYSNNKYPVDPFSTYTTSQSNMAYQKKQAEYKRKQQQYGGNN